MRNPDLHPSTCNLCGGSVSYVNNSKIYGSEFGSGYAYLCDKCGAYVGTHKSRPGEAMGILANEEMRLLKSKCHVLFDLQWSGGGKYARESVYKELATSLNIPVSDCHFGYFDLSELKEAYKLLCKDYADILISPNNPEF